MRQANLWQYLSATQRSDNYGEVWLPHALERKYPRAPRERGWQFVFPSGNRSADPESGVIRRHHIYPDTIHRAVKGAARSPLDRLEQPRASYAIT